MLGAGNFFMKTLKLVELVSYRKKILHESVLQAWENNKGRFYIELSYSDEYDCDKKFITLDEGDAQALIWELQRYLNSRSFIGVSEGANPNEN